MKKSSFNFDLPKTLIANRPLENRSSSRLLVLEKGGHCQHRHFYDLSKILRSGDLLVFNNTKVVPARLFGHKQTGGAVEILVERILSEHRVRAQVRASKSPKMGTEIILDGGKKITMAGRDEDMFLLDSTESWIGLMESIGHMPLPPYIEREDDRMDRQSYQTVYASNPGAVAAPTAGLHFDKDLLQQLTALGVDSAEVTLHVGAGTYQPVRVEDIDEHKMHSEWLQLSQEVVDKVVQTKARGGRVVAVGTTAVRSLESAFQTSSCQHDSCQNDSGQHDSGQNNSAQHGSGSLMPYTGDTDIFLYPGKSFQVVDALITNFHLPESTLLMLVSAFAGYTEIMSAYKEAVAEQYRFFSYGDAMFLTRNQDATRDIPQ